MHTFQENGFKILSKGRFMKLMKAEFNSKFVRIYWFNSIILCQVKWELVSVAFDERINNFIYFVLIKLHSFSFIFWLVFEWLGKIRIIVVINVM